MPPMPNNGTGPSSGVVPYKRAARGHALPQSSMHVILLVAALLCTAWAQNPSACSFTDPSGYALMWTVSNGNVNFNLTFRNFPTNSWTGVGFGDSMDSGIDAILVQMTGYQVQVVPATAKGRQPPVADAVNSVTTRSASFRDNTLRAEFSRPLNVNGKKSLTGCNTWDFITTPGSMVNGQYSKHNETPKQMQVCNVDTACRSGSGSLMQTLMPSNQISQNGYGQVVQTTTPSTNMNNRQFQPQGQNYNNQAMFNPSSNQYATNQNQNMYSSNNQYQQSNNQQTTPRPGNNFGYQGLNTATPPPLMPYTGSPFVYTTPSNPTYPNGQNSNSNMNSNNNFQNTNGVMYDARQPNNNQNNQNMLNYNQPQQYSMNNQQYQSSSPTSRMFNPSYPQSNQNMMSSSNQYPQNSYNQGSTPAPRLFDSTNNQQQSLTNGYIQPYPTPNSNQNSNNNQNMNSQMPSSQQMYYNPNQNMQQPQPYYGNSQAYQTPYAQQQQQQMPNQQQQQYSNTIPVMNYQPSPNYNSNSNNGYMNQYLLRKKRQSDRKKRQSGYQPTNNIYGYNTDSNAVDQSNLVINPNYKYLSGPLADEYAQSYNTAQRQYDQGQGQGSANMNLNGNAPLLSNSQQNTQNYQQIQRDSGSYQNGGQSYNNNPYGYNYNSNSASSSSNSIYSIPQYTPPNNANYPVQINYPANPNSTPSPLNRQFDPNNQNFQNQNFQTQQFQTQNNYQSASNLKTTTAKDQPLNPLTGFSGGVQRDQSSGSSYQNPPSSYAYYDPNTLMYYPYRTTSSVSNVPNTQQYSQGMNQGVNAVNSNQVLYDSTTGRMRDDSDPCSQPDPYWCDYYVSIFLSTNSQYNNLSQQQDCQALISSLSNSLNGCCNTARQAGCNV